MKPELEVKLESLLFSSGKRMTEDELAKLCKAPVEEVHHNLIELKRHYDEKHGSLMVMQDGHSWKLTVREQFLPLVKHIVTETELPKAVIETLAVIAFKHPILQAEIIKIRGNKGYDHLAELEESGYIGREPHGRTRKIKLTPKFFEYFDLPPEKLRDAFAGFEAVESAIIEKERTLAQRMKIYKQSAGQEPAAKAADGPPPVRAEPGSEDSGGEDAEPLDEQSTELPDELPEAAEPQPDESSQAEEPPDEVVTHADEPQEDSGKRAQTKGIEVFMHQEAIAAEEEKPREAEEELIDGTVDEMIDKKVKALEEGKTIKEPRKKDALDFAYDEISEDQADANR